MKSRLIQKIWKNFVKGLLIKFTKIQTNKKFQEKKQSFEN